MTSIPLSTLEDFIDLQQRRHKPFAKLRLKAQAYGTAALEFAIGGLILWLATYMLGDYFTLGVLVVFALGGLGVAHERRTVELAGAIPRGPKWLPTSGRIAAWSISYLLVVTVAWQWPGHPVPAWVLSWVMMLHFALMAWLLPDKPQAVAPDWWTSATTVRDAMVVAGILKPRPGDPQPLLSPGTPVETEDGVSTKWSLPLGSHWEDVLNKKKYFASAVCQDEERIMVTHDRGDAANIVRLTELKARARRTESLRSPLVTMDRCDWRAMNRIGEDPKTGQPVLIRNQDESGGLSAGLPDSGKTSLLRIKAGPYILDPTTTIYGMDGKGSREDYACLVPLTEDWIWGDDEDAVEHLEAMLTTVLDVVKSRNGRSDQKPSGGWPGLLLLLEELQEVRSAADKDTRERIDSLLGRIGRMGRAAGVKLEISTQRPAALDVPTGVRNILVQNLCLMTRSPSDAKLALGITPTLPLPSDKGEAIFVSAKHELAVDLDFIGLPDFRDMCSRGLALRGRGPIPNLTKTPVPVADVDPAKAFVDAVYDLLDQHRELQPVELLERLPESLRPTNIATLGKQVREHCRQVKKVERTTDRRQVYRFRAHGETPNLPSVRRQSAPGSRSKPTPTALPPGAPS